MLSLLPVEAASSHVAELIGGIRVSQPSAQPLCLHTHSAKYVWPNEHIKSFTVKAYVDFIFFLNVGLKSL